MKLRRATLVLAAMLLGVVVASNGLAARGGGGRSGGHGGGHSGGHGGGHSRGHAGHFHGHGGHFASGRHFAPRFRTRVFIGAPLFAPFYFYPPPSPYYYPEPVVVPSAPAYVEQYPGQIVPQQPSYWYYCSSANAYYPYVKECPEGWQQVMPQPPS